MNIMKEGREGKGRKGKGREGQDRTGRKEGIHCLFSWRCLTMRETKIIKNRHDRDVAVYQLSEKNFTL